LSGSCLSDSWDRFAELLAYFDVDFANGAGRGIWAQVDVENVDQVGDKTEVLRVQVAFPAAGIHDFHDFDVAANVERCWT